MTREAGIRKPLQSETHVEIGGAILVEYDPLAVDHEPLLAQFQRGLNDQREVWRPISRTRSHSRTTIIR